MKTPLRFAALIALSAVCSAFAQTTNYIAVGTKVVLVVSSDGTEPIDFTWLKDGNPITAGISADKKTLTFDSIALTDSGIYTAKAKNNWGEATSVEPFVISVGTPPSAPIIKAAFGNVSARKQTDVTLGIVAVGEDLKFRWQHGNALIAGANGPSILLRRVNQSDAGVYAVTASNPGGSATVTGRLVVRNN